MQLFEQGNVLCAVLDEGIDIEPSAEEDDEEKELRETAQCCLRGEDGQCAASSEDGQCSLREDVVSQDSSSSVNGQMCQVSSLVSHQNDSTSAK